MELCSASVTWEHVCLSETAPVVHVPEELQVELVNSVVNLLPVALHQLCIVHQLLLQENTPKQIRNVVFGLTPCVEIL